MIKLIFFIYLSSHLGASVEFLLQFTGEYFRLDPIVYQPLQVQVQMQVQMQVQLQVH